MTGAEPVSQLVDKGWSGTSTGDKVGVALAVAAVLPAGRLAEALPALPKLTGTLLKSFEGGEYTTKLYKSGTAFYRAEGADQGIGSFFGLVKPSTAGQAESMYNIAKWSNKAEVVSTYRLTKDTYMYTGKVAGGTGRQALVPRDINAYDIFKLDKKEPLQ